MASIPIGEWEAPLAREIFDTHDVEAVSRRVAEVWPFDECFALNASAGLTFGLRRGRRRVALKAYRPGDSLAGLDAARRMHERLWEQGLPTPRPLVGPFALGRTHAVVDVWAEKGEFRDLHEPRLRRAWAALFARLVCVATASAAPGLPRLRSDMWARPHSPRFDLARPDGAWIDDAAAATRDAVFGPVDDWAVGHGDWSAQQVRWDGNTPTVVYDWDSLARDSEANLVGYASGAFTAAWNLDVRRAPTPDEADAFVRDYEQARGTSLTAAQHRRVAAARTYVTAYIARCELSDAEGGDGEFQRALRELLVASRSRG